MLIFMRTYCVSGSKLLGISPDPHNSPQRQTLFLSPFYRCGNLEEIVAEQVWGRSSPRARKGNEGGRVGLRPKKGASKGAESQLCG